MAGTAIGTTRPSMNGIRRGRAGAAPWAVTAGAIIGDTAVVEPCVRPAVRPMAGITIGSRPGVNLVGRRGGGVNARIARMARVTLPRCIPENRIHVARLAPHQPVGPGQREGSAQVIEFRALRCGGRSRLGVPRDVQNQHQQRSPDGAVCVANAAPDSRYSAMPHKLNSPCSKVRAPVMSPRNEPLRNSPYPINV